MRLINVQTLELEEFYSEIPNYAILSHCWGDEEISFSQWQNACRSAKGHQGSTKIKRACAEAKSHGYGYLWCDTNCIDKSSSAELSEAINSMFNWYGKSSICLAYLDDVFASPECPGTGSYQQRWGYSFCASRWFTRGWTLQELLAPAEVRFYDKDWQFIGSRSTLADDVSRATGIDTTFLEHNSGLRADYDLFEETRNKLAAASIAKRMSWLSKRKTSRVEDLAYCMLGIFDINMPLLYGEGTKAFQRLQEEIIRVTNDMTIFCWHWDDRHVSPGWDSMLAPSPLCFEDSGGYQERLADDSDRPTTTYSITNAGLSINLQVVPAGRLVLALLDVAHSNYSVVETRIAICLVQPRHLAADVCVRARLPPLPVPATCRYVPDGRNIYLIVPIPLQDTDMQRRSMHIPFRQVHLRPKRRQHPVWLDEQAYLHRSELAFETGVLVVLSTSVHAVLDQAVAPKNILPLQLDWSSNCSIGILPICVYDQNITIWFGFGISHASRGVPRRVQGARLGFTSCDARSMDQHLAIYARKMVGYLAPSKTETGSVNSTPGDDSPIEACHSLGPSIRLNARSELAVALIAVHYIADILSHLSR